MVPWVRLHDSACNITYAMFIWLPSIGSNAESTSKPPVTRPPTMKTLTLLKWQNEGKIEKFQTKKQIFLKWRDIGILLEIPWQVLEDWQRTKQSSEVCCDAVINHWLNNPTEEYPATWEGLYDLLEDCELDVVASNLKKAVANATR